MGLLSRCDAGEKGGRPSNSSATNNRISGRGFQHCINRIPGTIVYIRPLKLQAALQVRDLARYCELVGVGHRFGKMSVLATMPSQIYPGELEWNADRLKLNGWFAKPNKDSLAELS